MDIADYTKYVERLKSAKTVDEIQALAPTGFSTAAGLKDWETRRTGALEAITQQGAKSSYPAMVDYAQATGGTDPRFFNDPESRAVLAEQGTTGDIGPFAAKPTDPTAATALTAMADRAQTEGNLRDYISGDATPNVLAQLAASDNTKAHMTAIKGLAEGYQLSQGIAPKTLEQQKYDDTKKVAAGQADFQNDITGIAGYSHASQPRRFNESPTGQMIPVIPTGPNVDPKTGLDYSDANGNPTKPVLRPLAEVQDLYRQAAAGRGVDPKDALAEVVKLYETNRTDAQGLPSALSWAGKEDAQSDNQLYAAAQRGDRGAQRILAAKQSDAVRVAKEKGENARITVVSNPMPAKVTVNGMSEEEQAAINNAVVQGRLDPYKVNSRNQKMFAGIEMANPGTDLNKIAANLGVARNKDVIMKAGIAEMIPALIQNIAKTGTALNYSNNRWVGMVQQGFDKVTNNEQLTKYMTLRNDGLLTIGGVMRGNGMTDMAQRLEEEAAHPTMSPRALNGWLQGQMESTDPRIAMYRSILAGKGTPQSSYTPPTHGAPKSGKVGKYSYTVN